MERWSQRWKGPKARIPSTASLQRRTLFHSTNIFWVGTWSLIQNRQKQTWCLPSAGGGGGVHTHTHTHTHTRALTHALPCAKSWGSNRTLREYMAGTSKTSRLRKASSASWKTWHWTWGPSRWVAESQVAWRGWGRNSNKKENVSRWGRTACAKAPEVGVSVVGQRSNHPKLLVLKGKNEGWGYQDQTKRDLDISAIS